MKKILNFIAITMTIIALSIISFTIGYKYGSPDCDTLIKSYHNVAEFGYWVRYKGKSVSEMHLLLDEYIYWSLKNKRIEKVYL